MKILKFKGPNETNSNFKGPEYAFGMTFDVVMILKDAYLTFYNIAVNKRG